MSTTANTIATAIYMAYPAINKRTEQDVSGGVTLFTEPEAFELSISDDGEGGFMWTEYYMDDGDWQTGNTDGGEAEDATAALTRWAELVTR